MSERGAQHHDLVHAAAASTPPRPLQVQWMRSFVLALQRPPQYLRALNKRGTFFCRKPAGLPPKKNIARLLQQVRSGGRDTLL